MRLPQIVLMVLFVFPLTINAQKYLQLEKRNSPKTRKFYAGQSLHFQLDKEKDNWYEREIYDIDVTEEILRLHDGMVKVEDISVLKEYNKGLANSVAYSLYSFGAGWALFSLGDALVQKLNDRPSRLGWEDAAIAGGSILSGWIFRKIMYSKQYKMGDKWRLRVIDITPGL